MPFLWVSTLSRNGLRWTAIHRNWRPWRGDGPSASSHDAEREQFRKQWHTYHKAFLSAVDYLHHRFPVHDESYLPSANMLATLSVFFFHHTGQPNSYQIAEIRKWFWATGV